MVIAKNGELRTKTGRTTTVVAGSDSPDREEADYICDGTDDDVEIQSAIDALPSYGKCTLLGTFNIGSIINLKSDISLEILGTLNLGTDVRRFFFIPTALHDISINGGLLNGNKASQSANLALISGQGLRRVLIENMYIKSIDYDGINLDGWYNSTISNCVIEDCDHLGIRVHAGEGNSVAGCAFKDMHSGVKGGIWIDGRKHSVRNCRFEGANGHAGVDLGSNAPFETWGNSIIDNKFFESGGTGLVSESNVLIYDTVIAHNIFAPSLSVGLSSAWYGIVDGNIFESTRGIENGTGSLVVNNRFEGCDYGIRRYSGSTSLFLNNFFKDCTTAIYQDNGGPDDLVQGNVFKNNGTVMVIVNGTLKWEESRFDLFMDVLAASATAVHAAIAGTGAEQEITTAITNPDVPRNVSLTNSANSTGDVKIDGIDARGNTVSDTITIVTGGIAYGVVAFATVSKITIPATVVNPDTITVGVSDKLGLSNVIYASGDVYKVKVNNADDPTIGTVSTTYHTVDCATINPADDITIWYMANLNTII